MMIKFKKKFSFGSPNTYIEMGYTFILFIKKLLFYHFLLIQKVFSAHKLIKLYRTKQFFIFLKPQLLKSITKIKRF